MPTQTLIAQLDRDYMAGAKARIEAGGGIEWHFHPGEFHRGCTNGATANAMPYRQCLPRAPEPLPR